MKVIILGDLHIGVSKDDPAVQAYQKRFLEFACHYAAEHGITVGIQTGDWFDTRAGVTQECMRFQRTELNDILSVFDTMYVLVGNHDAHLKNSLFPNSVREILYGYSPYVVVEEPMTVSIGSTMWDLIPWECNENRKQIREFIARSDSDYNVGHWELGGFDFYKGVVAQGEDADFLDRYKQVFSGHYHTSSKKGNVLYVGTPYTLTMGDANEVRGFWVVDTDTGEREFIHNPYGTMHLSIPYNDLFDPSIISDCAGKSVVLVVHKSDDKLNGVLSQMEDVCHEFRPKYIEDLSVGDLGQDDEIRVNKIMDTITLHVNSLDRTDDEKRTILRMSAELYAEATTV